MLTRKHYIAIAAIVKENELGKKTAEKLADYFESDNSNFCRDRFIAASAPTSDKVKNCFESLLDYACKEHKYDHEEGHALSDEAECDTCAWLSDAKEIFKIL